MNEEADHASANTPPDEARRVVSELRAHLRDDKSGATVWRRDDADWTSSGYQVGLGKVFRSASASADSGLPSLEELLEPAWEGTKALHLFVTDCWSHVEDAAFTRGDVLALGAWRDDFATYELELSTWVESRQEVEALMRAHPEQREYFDWTTKRSVPRDPGWC